MPRCALPAQVSDHEWLALYPELAEVAGRARALVGAGRGEEVVARLHVADNAPMTARRFLSLYDAGGDDDMFSLHFSEPDLQVSHSHQHRHRQLHFLWG